VRDDLRDGEAPLQRCRRHGDDIALRARMARPQRLGTFDDIGRYRYFVTSCTLNRRPLFVQADLVASVESHFLEHAARFGCAILAYCFMPDHVHLLVEGLTDDADMRAFVAIPTSHA
jgi:Transposase IS200 like